jgi:hypothetical protein
MAQHLEIDAIIKGGNGNLPRHPGGRPVKLTVERFLRICALVERGITNTQACQAEGINYSGFRSHVRRKPWWAKRFQHADQIRDEYLRDFHLANVTKDAKGYQDGETFVRGSWAASAWILERKFPQLFALRYTQHRTGDNAEKPQYAELTREQLLASIARAKELEAEAPVGWQPLPDAAPTS